jgi:prophage maintenance system killer protein
MMNISTTHFPLSPIQKIPGYFTTQIHPENDVVPILVKVSNQFAKAHSSFQLKEALRASLFLEDRLGYAAALKYIEEHLLLCDLNQLTEDAFLLEIKKINWLVVQDQYGRGEYRSNNVIVWNDAIMPKVEHRNAEAFKQIDKHILNNCTSEQRELWQTTRKKVWDIAFKKNHHSHAPITFTDEEKQLMQSLAGFPPDHSEVPKMMSQFARDFFDKIKKKEDLFTIMAWAHQKLVEIHAFVDGNGRTARLIMNLIGMWNGKLPLLITENAAYSTAARTLDPEQFANYLRQLDTQQIKIHEVVSQTLRDMFDNYCQQFDWSVVRANFAHLQ